MWLLWYQTIRRFILGGKKHKVVIPQIIAEMWDPTQSYEGLTWVPFRSEGIYFMPTDTINLCFDGGPTISATVPKTLLAEGAFAKPGRVIIKPMGEAK